MTTKKIDSEYVSNEICSIFAFIEALAGRHHVSVREHRTAIDWAEEIKYLVDVMYPDKEKIILVMDNLNTHFIQMMCGLMQRLILNHTGRTPLPTALCGSWWSVRIPA